MKEFILKKFFSKKENSVLLENIADISSEPVSVMDSAGSLIAGGPPAAKSLSFPIKIEGEEIGRVSGKRGAKGTAYIKDFIEQLKNSVPPALNYGSVSKNILIVDDDESIRRLGSRRVCACRHR